MADKKGGVSRDPSDNPIGMVMVRGYVMIKNIGTSSALLP